MATSARRLLLLLCVVCCVGRSQQCRLYLAPSKLPHAGNGIFAGQAYSKHDQVEYGPVLFVPKAFARHWQLMNYVYGKLRSLPRPVPVQDVTSATAFHPRPAYVFVVFGVSMLFNHQDTPNLYHEDEDSDDWDPPLQQEFPYLVTNYQTFLADASVQAGEELFSSYGDEWFSARELEVMNASSMPSTRYSADYLAASGVCISDVSIGQSDLLPGELGVFAERSFQVGDRVVWLKKPCVLIRVNPVVSADGLACAHAPEERSPRRKLSLRSARQLPSIRNLLRYFATSNR